MKNQVLVFDNTVYIYSNDEGSWVKVTIEDHKVIVQLRGNYEIKPVDVINIKSV